MGGIYVKFKKTKGDGILKKASLVVSEYLQNNVIFDEQSKQNRDNIFSPFIKLKEKFLLHNYEMNTVDITSIVEAEIVIYLNIPQTLPDANSIPKSYLILSESELIRPDNYDDNKHKNFSKIFTWHDDLIDNIKYFKLNFSHLFPEEINKDVLAKDKLVTLIAGNKSIIHPLELYSKRIEAIRWFEQNHLEKFDLYGVGWEKYRFGGSKIIRALNRIPYLASFFEKVMNKRYISYRGVVDNKKRTMENYRFSICYENAKDIPGYITEKIFDSFFAGCVPIYWGANNITDYVPEDCFIDKTAFNTYEELFIFIIEMSDSDYTNYLDNIEYYLKSEASYTFSDNYYAQKIVNTILNEELR